MELQLLAPEQIHEYGALLLPIQRPLLSSPSENHVIFVAKVGGAPAGLAVAELFDQGIAARILNLFVSQEHRQHGIGTALLAGLEAELSRRDIQWLYLGYLSELSTSRALERILKKRAWEAPTDHKIVWKAYAKSIIEAPWAPKPGWPAGYETFLWSERTAHDRMCYERMWEEKSFHRGLGPHPEHTDFEPLNSLGVRREGQLVGWLVTNRIAPNAVRYTWLYATPDMARLGRGIPLMRDALRLQVQELGTETVATAGSMVSNPEAVNFVRRRLAPYLLSLTVSKQSVKKL